MTEQTGSVALRIEKLSKRYPGAGTWSVRDFSLSVSRGEFVALLGPSGCGKTTTLRMLAGLVDPTGGEIFLEGRTLRNVPAHRRNIGLVFQHYALFPLLNVFENIAYGLRERRIPEREVERRVAEVLDMVHLLDVSRRKPRELSGGQQQRVALARALVIAPHLLLLDEPLGSLDARLRQQLRGEIKRLQEKLGTTTIFVTHDQEEALSMARTIVVMRNAAIEQIGTPEELYQRPATSFVANFMGSCNFLKARAASRRAGSLLCVIEGSPLEIEIEDDSVFSPGGALTLAIRPERVEVTTDHAPPKASWPGTVMDATYLGAVTSYDVEVSPGLRLAATVLNKGKPPFSRGSTVAVSWSEGAWRTLAQ
jgi:ABC-type Fe3+/spermidine/putrescine transport system ATPase subunit